jgi:DNA invertase Pin-like site-specific DNA recombinase
MHRAYTRKPVVARPMPNKTLLYLIVASDRDKEDQLRDIKSAGITYDGGQADRQWALRDPPKKRRGFKKVMAEIQARDTLVVPRLHCLGRKLDEVVDTLEWLQWKQVTVRCPEAHPTAVLTEIDIYGSSVPAAVVSGREFRRVIALCAGLERSERARKLAARHTTTKRQGRPHVLSTNKRREAVDRVAMPGATMRGVAKVLKVSRQTLYRALKAEFGAEYHAQLAARRAAVAAAMGI